MNISDKNNVLYIYYNLGKIDRIKDFVEFRCKDRDERERYAEEVVKRQKEKRKEIKQKLESLKIITKEFGTYN